VQQGGTVQGKVDGRPRWQAIYWQPQPKKAVGQGEIRNQGRADLFLSGAWHLTGA